MKICLFLFFSLVHGFCADGRIPGDIDGASLRRVNGVFGPRVPPSTLDADLEGGIHKWERSEVLEYLKDKFQKKSFIVAGYDIAEAKEELWPHLKGNSEKLSAVHAGLLKELREPFGDDMIFRVQSLQNFDMSVFYITYLSLLAVTVLEGLFCLESVMANDASKIEPCRDLSFNAMVRLSVIPSTVTILSCAAGNLWVSCAKKAMPPETGSRFNAPDRHYINNSVSQISLWCTALVSDKVDRLGSPIEIVSSLKDKVNRILTRTSKDMGEPLERIFNHLDVLDLEA